MINILNFILLFGGGMGDEPVSGLGLPLVWMLWLGLGLILGVLFAYSIPFNERVMSRGELSELITGWITGALHLLVASIAIAANISPLPSPGPLVTILGGVVFVIVVGGLGAFIHYKIKSK